MKPFSTTLAELRGGDVNSEMAEAIAEVTERVRLTGKKGAVVLKLVIEPASAGDVERVKVSDYIEARAPKAPRPATMFFANANNDLVRNDPAQQNLMDALKSAPEAPAARDVKEVK